MKRYFVVTPAPEARESLRGYMLRLAELNGYGGLPHLAANLGVKSTTPLDGYSLEKLAERTGVPLSILKARIGHFQLPGRKGPYVYRGSDALIYQHQSHLYRYCPACLEEGGYVRAGWHVLLYAACLRHRLLLQIRCPDCGKFQRWDRTSVTRCPCGALLKNGDRDAVSRGLLLTQAALDFYARLSACKEVDGRLVERSRTLPSNQQALFDLGRRIVKNLVDHRATPRRDNYSPYRAGELLEKCAHLYLWATSIDPSSLEFD